VIIDQKTLHREILEDYLCKYINPDAELTLDAGSKNRRYDSLIKKSSYAFDLIPNESSDIKYGDVTKFCMKDKFDQILCIEVLCYLDQQNIQRALNRLIKSLKKGGLLLFTIPYCIRDNGGNLMISERELKNILAKEKRIRYKTITFGNSTTVAFDCMLYKYKSKFHGWFTPLKIPFGLSLTLLRAVIHFLKLHQNRDEFYSGTFVVVQK